AVFVCYLAGMLMVGVYCSRYNKDIGDFVLGGRRLGPWVAAFSAQASDFSGWLLIGLPAMAYEYGFSLTWTCLGCLSGVMFDWVVLAPRLRRLSAEYGALTVPDFLEARFNDRTHIIRILAVLIILAYYVTYISAQFIAAGEVFATAFGEQRLPWGEGRFLGIEFSYYRQGLLIGATIILLYTALGGFLAVCWTDFVQAILMVGTMTAVPIIGVIHLGGFSELWSAMAASTLSDHMLAVHDGKVGASFVCGVVIAGLSWGMGYPGQPHIVARFMAIEDEKKIPKSALISVVWSVFALYGSMFVGFVALGVLGDDLEHTNRATPMLAVTLLPGVLAGLVLSAAVAAMMSTVDSQIIVAVGAVVRDGYQKLLGGQPADRTAIWLSRIVVVVLGAGGLTLAWQAKSVFAQVLDAWGGLAAGLGPAIVLGCLWRRTSRVGVIVGMMAGVALVQAWEPLMTILANAGWDRLATHLGSTKLFTTVVVNLVLVVLLSLGFPQRAAAPSPARSRT
ncbi:MAG: sodium/proline symporter, partial [Phycisphaerales bacterium]